LVCSLGFLIYTGTQSCTAGQSAQPQTVGPFIHENMNNLNKPGFVFDCANQIYDIYSHYKIIHHNYEKDTICKSNNVQWP
jgi:hypothetical protein